MRQTEPSQYRIPATYHRAPCPERVEPSITRDVHLPMRPYPFTRPTIIAATELLDVHSQASINKVLLRLCLETEVPLGTEVSVAKKCAMIAQAVVKRPTDVLDTLEGPMTLGEAVVHEAVQVVDPSSAFAAHVFFLRGLARDGFVLVPGRHGIRASIRAALPAAIQLPSTDDEVHHLLKHYGFDVPRGHLNQAIDAHTRGNWAGCNGQLRTFLESLLDDIARHLCPQEAAAPASAENRRALLGSIGFLSPDRGEWSGDGKNYVSGLFKMLHTHGSHPGLSDEDHSTFRLHVVLVTAGMLLRRLYRPT